MINYVISSSINIEQFKKNVLYYQMIEKMFEKTNLIIANLNFYELKV